MHLHLHVYLHPHCIEGSHPNANHSQVAMPVFGSPQPLALYKSFAFCKGFIGFSQLGEPHQETVKILMLSDSMLGAFVGNDQKVSRNDRAYKVSVTTFCGDRKC